MQNMPNLLPGVPLVESPFFDDFLNEKTLTAEELRIANDLRSRGYAIFDFPDAEFDTVAENIKEEIESQFDFSAWKNGDLYDLRSQDAWKNSENVRKISNNEEIVSIISKIYGRQAFPFQSLTFPVGTQQRFHSDSIHFSSMPERFMCGVWVALEDIDIDQGPLIYYPGSHAWPIYTNEHIGYSHFGSKITTQHIYEPVWEALVAAHDAQPARFTAKKGQALIWAANLLHGGDRHLNNQKTRWSQVTHYLFDNCAYYTPMGTDYPFGSVQFREPYNILTGEKVRNQYNGREIPRDFIDFTDPTRVYESMGEVQLPSNFDSIDYLAANPDVAAAGADPKHHYLRYGIKEGRPISLKSRT